MTKKLEGKAHKVSRKENLIYTIGNVYDFYWSSMFGCYDGIKEDILTLYSSLVELRKNRDISRHMFYELSDLIIESCPEKYEDVIELIQDDRIESKEERLI